MEFTLLDYAVSFFSSTKWLAVFFIVFGALGWWTPCNPKQPVTRTGMITDTMYFLLMPLINRVAGILFVLAGFSLLFHGQPKEAIAYYLENGYGPLSRQPLWLQAALVTLLTDFYLYWAHRWFHKRPMWKFHAIHHSPEHVDWLSTYRFHFVNSWLAFVVADTLMLCLGFSPAAVYLMASVNMVYSAMVHANLNWTFGKFRYLFASPVFHRWHHTSQAEGRDKNFAPTFPLIDIMFGTFYMPEGKLPEKYGISERIPENFFSHLVWPFKQR